MATVASTCYSCPAAQVGAENMGPADVVSYCMRSITQEAEQGSKTLMSFAVKAEDKPEDFVGQLQPGYFQTPQDLIGYWTSNPRYETMARMSEWKPMGPPDFSDNSRKAAQKLLVRRDGSNWEELFINMQLVATGGDESVLPTRRWLITSIYKQGTP